MEPLRPTASEVLPSDNIPPLVFVQEGNTMALALLGRQVRVPSTLVPSGRVDALVPILRHTVRVPHFCIILS